MEDRATEVLPSTPVARRLLDYWRNKLNGRKAPRRWEILPEELGDLLPWVILVDVAGSPPRFRVRLAGTGVVREYGAEMTGLFLDDLDMGGMRERSLEDHRRAVQECRPVVGTFDFKKDDGRWVTYEWITLPLSADGETVNMLLCGARMHGAASQAEPIVFRAATRTAGGE
ncbi:MAG TPA: PAS domain-containing protein [Stellaceae bacterium]|nr:PAS domain-containing protein [Stellaceae bacterium]